MSTSGRRVGNELFQQRSKSNCGIIRRSYVPSSSYLRLAFAASAVCIAIWCCISFLVGTSAITRRFQSGFWHGSDLPSLAHLTPLGLQRSLSASSLEQAIDKDINVGACTLSKHMLPGMSELDCATLYCMWSPRLQANIDFWFNALQPYDRRHRPPLEPCHEPRGGQVPHTNIPTQLAFIITAHNSGKLAAQGLLETFRAAGEVESAEIVVVDDGSTEDMTILREACRRLKEFFGTQVQYIVNKKAKGYGAANMQGVLASRAQYVMLLNSDAFMMKGAAYAMLRTVQEVPDAGIVGPVFIGADHRVSEGGGIVFSNAEAGNYGRGRLLGHALNFRRPVDYISAACVIFRRELFLDVGGFDPIYGVGYFEDTDLAMTMRNRGLQVLYQPLAVVFHQEGTTLGTDDSPRKKMLMARNQKTFAKKWTEPLKKHCVRPLGYDVASRRHMSPKVLWIDDIVPETDRDSGSIRTWNMLQMLVRHGYDVSFQPTASGRMPTYTQQARFGGVDILPVRAASDWKLSFEGVCKYDAILIARRYVFDPVKDIIAAACPSTPILYDTVDLHFLRESRDLLSSSQAGVHFRRSLMADAGGGVPDSDLVHFPEPDESDRPQLGAAGGLQAGKRDGVWNFNHLSLAAVLRWLDSDDPRAAPIKKNREVELALIDRSTLTIVVSATEVDAIRHYRPQANVRVISNIHEFRKPPRSATEESCKRRRGVLFVGNLQHGPNRQAIEQLLTIIIPRAKALLPARLQQDFVLHLVGANMPPGEDGVQLRALLKNATAAGNVIFHGHLSEDLIQMLYGSVKAMTAPLLSGAGVKGKVNQAMKYGVPVVATPIAAEGMHIRDKACLVARNPDEFVRQVVAVYSDCRLWSELVEGGYENMRKHFSVESAEEDVLDAFRMVGAGPVAAEWRDGCSAKVDAQE